MIKVLRSFDKNFTHADIKAAVSVLAIANATTIIDLLVCTTA